MKKRILSIMLAICMVSALVPQAAFAANAQVKYTPITGTVKSGSERYGMLLDGDPDTKWCVPSFNDDAYIIFQTSSAVNVSGYVITTGNDNEENPGRNPKNWILYGCNDYNESSVSGSWEVIHSVANDNVLQDKNKTEYHFVFDKTNTAYEYYKLQITEIQSGSAMQMSEFALIDCDHNWVSTTKPATCTEQGYTKEYCSKCNAVKKFDVIAGLLGHDFSGEGGKCIRCFKTKEELYRISVTTYATKAQLMDGTFKPYDNGTADLTGKLVFGKKSNGAPQKWFILGKDSGVTGDNTIIFAEDSIKKGQVFNSDKNNKGYAHDGGTGYGDIPYVTTVYANHYGASELRAALKSMTDGTNTTYFTRAEQNMMNATTVKTWDVKNNLEYTTTDKLYAANFTGTFGLSILVGSGSGRRLYVDPFWNSGDTFWLRAPASDSSDCALFALIGKYVENKPLDRVIWGEGVRPAGNLNLSDVLFASAAKPSAEGITVGTIEAGEAMTLRMDGSSKKIGSVKYDASRGIIVAEAGTWVMSGPVSLIVQGNDGTRDWYFSKRLGITFGGETVSKDQIMAATGAIGISLADCKIWIEGTNSFEGITYAVPATEASIPVTTINSIKLTGMTPTAGQEFPAQASCSTTGIIPDKPEITYTTAEGVPVTGTADWETTYRATVSLGTFNFNEYQYVFGKEVTATVDGKPLSAPLSPNGEGKITITREFTTEKRYSITDIKKPSVPTDNLFTNYYGNDGYAALPVNGSEFGKQATVTVLDRKENTTKNKTVNVTWTTANNNGADYDPTPGAANTFKWTVLASALADYDVTGCPGYDPASGTITGTVSIKNKAATPVNITGTDRSITYTETDIDVSQYFTIDPKAGTKTYTLMDGGTGAGTLSGTALTVTAAGTFKIKVNTAVNGIYAAGEKTITLTVKDGTIKYSASDYSGTYDGQKHSISVSVTTPTGSTVKYSTDGTNYGNVNPSFTDAGTYTVYFKIEGENYGAVEGCKTVTINKKAIRITAQDQEIVWGNGIDQSAYSVSENGIVTGDSIAEITLTSSTTALTDNGTISISDVKIENAADKDVTGNYNIATSNGILKITRDMTLAPKKVETVKRKTSYIAGDALNVDDITVTAYYSDGFSEEVTDFTTNAADIDMATAGHKTLTISYGKNGETKNIIIKVSHNTALAPESIDAVKTTTSYIAGDALNVDDITVTAYYSDGFSEEVTDFTTNVADINMSRAGEKTLTVSYFKNGETRTADITITVTSAGGGGGVYVPPVQKPAEPTEPTKEEILAVLADQKLAARSKLVTLKNGKKSVRITWYSRNGEMMDFDGVEIYRSTKRNSGYGKKPIFTSVTDKYYNTAVKKGTKYYYKVRGFVIIDGQKYYTDWSLKAIRTVK